MSDIIHEEACEIIRDMILSDYPETEEIYVHNPSGNKAGSGIQMIFVAYVSPVNNEIDILDEGVMASAMASRLGLEYIDIRTLDRYNAINQALLTKTPNGKIHPVPPLKSWNRVGVQPVLQSAP